jgi:diaminopimelate decarboxylase
MQVKNNRLCLGEIDAESLAREYGTPLYVYEEEVIRSRFADLLKAIPYPALRIHYACKANSNIEILKLLRSLGANAETVSRGEILLAFKAGFAPHQILHTCSNISADELRFVIDSGVVVNLDSLGQLRHYGDWYSAPHQRGCSPGAAVSIRINGGIGAGYHPHVITGGPDSKFGIDVSQLDEAKALAEKVHLRNVGVHQHIGSNVLDAALLVEAMKTALDSAATFKGLEFVDLGGGLGVPYRPDEKPLDVRQFGALAAELFDLFCRRYGKKLSMVLEPGRYLVAEAGTLVATVTDVKRTPFHTFVGVDTGFNHLVRPAMYGSYHPILNASRVDGQAEVVCVAGNLCEAGDLLARDRAITECREGDTIAILNAGAYGFSMSSNYNARPRPAEVMVCGGRARVIRPREEGYS